MMKCPDCKDSELMVYDEAVMGKVTPYAKCPKCRVEYDLEDLEE